MKRNSLTIIGSGIKSLAHLTREATTYIAQSDKVLYLVNEPLIEEWIKKNSKSAESLNDLYFKYPLRLQSYKAITHYILENLIGVHHLSVVLYGHPTVFAQPALDAVIQAKKEGFITHILPGVSAEDCLFADLLIDPGEYGCLSLEATDFLIRPRVFSPSSHLILWQIGCIGLLQHQSLHDNKRGAEILLKKLSEFYPQSHPVIIYEAAQYAHFQPRIDQIPLKKLPKTKVTALSTLYVPPVSKAEFDHDMLKTLNIDIVHLQ